MSGLLMTGLSDAGILRAHNEDRYLIDPDQGLAILADGMGGHLAGEVASAMAIEVIHRSLNEALAQAPEKKIRGAASFAAEAVRRAVECANRAIYSASHERPECHGMGTTVVMALVRGSKLYTAHVGDSRLYRLRRGKLAQLTEDHSLVQEMLRDGLISVEQARTSANRNLVTRALGVDPSVQTDVGEQTVRTGDVYLLCSDGLSDVLADEEIERTLMVHVGDFAAAARDLVAQANARGGPDNISVVLIGAGETAKRRKKTRRRYGA